MNIFKFDTLNFISICLAAWRLASMIANENGSFWMFKRFRAYAAHLTNTNRFFASFHFQELVECEWCNSIWIAAPLTAAWLTFGNVVIYGTLFLSISTIVVVIKYIIQNLEMALNIKEQQYKILKAQAEQQEGILSVGNVPVGSSIHE